MFKKIKNWLSAHNIYSEKFYKSHGKIKKSCAIVITSIIAFLMILALAATLLINSFLGKIDRPPNQIDAGVSSDENDLTEDGIFNVMLYGLDAQSQNEISRSDSITLVTIDKNNLKIKMTSISRDTLVDIPEFGPDKLNHAFAYGWAKTGNLCDGAALSLQTINSSFGLSVKDYVTANFWALTHIIDYVGGVEVDVSAAELKQINLASNQYAEKFELEFPKLEKAGYQRLTGAQALAYSRIRNIDSDTVRTHRQREVLTSLFKSAQNINPLKYPQLIRKLLKECTTSCTNEQILEIGSWVVANIKNIKFETISIPTSEISNGTMINGTWYNNYDLNKASNIMKEFIFETPNTLSN